MDNWEELARKVKMIWKVKARLLPVVNEENKCACHGSHS